MLTIKMEAEASAYEPSVDAGLVTWWKVSVTRNDRGTAGPVLAVGKLRVATINVGLALNLGESVADLLDADSDELEELYAVFFEGDWLRERFQSGSGGGLLFVAEMDLDDTWRRRDADLAIVDRLVDTLGMGCDIVVLATDERAHHERWARIGFDRTSKRGGFQYRNESLRHPRAAEVGDDRFEIRNLKADGDEDDDS